jgi:hypothetical protein
LEFGVWGLEFGVPLFEGTSLRCDLFFLIEIYR